MKKNEVVIKIDKGIPIPVRTHGYCKAVLSKMKVGDSFLIGEIPSATIYSAARHLEIGVAIRKGRCWRIE